jgi:choline dehydrogenase-like flavoprotein
MSSLQDPIRDGIARGWKILGGTPGQSPEGTHKPLPTSITVDVAIIGSGAGAGITAELLTQAGLSVLIVEEGPLKSSRDFKQLESEAYPSLYQESAARKTADKAINILQGRCVGGSTTVNWTSSFRTPEATLTFWQERFGLKDFTPSALDPFFRQAETRLNIGPWLTPPNENNDILRRGALKLGIPSAAIKRNVKGCWNIGSCGMGCPTNAKQSMLVTTIPAALDAGATLWVETRAERFEFAQSRVSALFVQKVMPNSAPARIQSAQSATKIVAKHYVLAAGAINSPAVLLRSRAVDPHGVLGRRTFLHPVVLSAAVMANKVEGWTGAPQTIYSDHFLETQPIDGPIGFKLEAPPLHPVIFASTVSGYGAQQAALFKQFAFTHTLIALMRDGFHEQSPGGSVSLRGDGSPSLDYPLNAFVMDGARRALLSMMEIQFAAGAQEVMPVHEQVAKPFRSWKDAQAAITTLPMEPLLTKVVSAHVMGGCGLAGNEKQGVVRPDGLHWQIDNLSVHDGSIFPTSVGANPQLSIYGIVNRLAQGLAQRLAQKSVVLA